jgi:hypothetical protein
MTQYRVLQGIDYPPNKRAEAGDVVGDIPAQSVKWLLDSGIIEDTDKPTKKTEQPVVEEPKVEPVAEIVEEPVVAEVVEEPVAEIVEEPAIEEGFDADATDGDGDGFLQDGTPHQRPVEEK